MLQNNVFSCLKIRFFHNYEFQKSKGHQDVLIFGMAFLGISIFFEKKSLICSHHGELHSIL
jgi:hypothetical protein